MALGPGVWLVGGSSGASPAVTVTETRTEILEHANKQPPCLYPLILIHVVSAASSQAPRMEMEVPGPTSASEQVECIRRCSTLSMSGGLQAPLAGVYAPRP